MKLLANSVERKLMVTASICLLCVYTVMVTFRPDLALRGEIASNIYLPDSNILFVGTAGIILLALTHNLLYTLLIGAFGTIIWEVIAFELSIYLAGFNMISYNLSNGLWIFRWLTFAVAFLVFIRYFKPSIQPINRLNVWTLLSGIIYLFVTALWFVAPELTISTWIHNLKYTANTDAPWFQIVPSGLMGRASGYVFWALCSTTIAEAIR